MRASLHPLFAFLGLLSLAAHAGPHAHGEARLDLSIDKERIELSLELPLDAAVGFERAPRTAAEKAALAATASVLADAAVFTPSPAAQCQRLSSEVTLPYADGASKSATAEHADVSARYVFRCARPDALSRIETTLFQQFKRLYRIEVQRIGPRGQGAQRLSPKQPAISW